MEEQFVRVGMLNDGWGGGFTEITDDYRTMGMNLESQFQLNQRSFYLFAQASSLTLRQIDYQIRMDELELLGGVEVFQPASWLRFDALIGAYYYGDLGLQDVQNRVHEWVDVPSVSLAYEAASTWSPMLGLRLLAEKSLEPSDRLKGLGYARATWSSQHVNQLDVGLGLAYVGDYSERIQLNFGYQDFTTSNSEVRQQVSDRESGWYVDYRTQLGLAYVSMRIYPESGFSTGTLGLQLGMSKNRKVLETVDLHYELGSLLDENGLYQRLLLPRLFGESPFYADIVHQFWSIPKNRLTTYPYQKGHYEQISAGIQYSPVSIRKGAQVHPYVSARLGYRIESVYPGFGADPSNDLRILNAIGEVGMRVKLPGNFIHPNCYYGFTGSFMYTLPMSVFGERIPTMSYPFARRYGNLGVGVFVMVDL